MYRAISALLRTWCAACVAALSKAGLVSGLASGLFFGLAVSYPAIAAAAPVSATCHAAVHKTVAAPQITARNVAWNCSGRDYLQRRMTNLLRFEVEGQDAPSRYFVSSIGSFETISLTVRDRDGTLRTADYTMAQSKPVKGGPFFILELPRVTSDSIEVIAAMDGTWSASTITQARLTSSVREAAWPIGTLLVLAAICGLLCAPLFFNLGFWHVLRERFLLWHMVVAIGMIGQTLISSGIILWLVPLTHSQMNPLMQAALAVSLSGACMFAADFIEKDRLPEATRKALRLCAAFIVISSAVYAFKIPAMRDVGNQLYYASFIPMMLVLALSMAQAARRGSRAVWFQIIAWTPIYIIGLVRVGSNLGIGPEPTDALVPFTLAIGFEVLITSLGVADRFMIIKEQRDHARADAAVLGSLSRRDPLTGLMNRRAIEPKFAALRADGFDTFALVDLDHFKRVNDDFGHACGDAVLVAVAAALDADDDTLAVRLGGEEFLLLLRGPDAAARAERRRQAIPGRVARCGADLDRLVTASMGLVELPERGMEKIDFAELYTRADRLLYEAKSAGRNRTMSEKLTYFEPGGTKAVASAAA